MKPIDALSGFVNDRFNEMCLDKLADKVEKRLILTKQTPSQTGSLGVLYLFKDKSDSPIGMIVLPHPESIDNVHVTGRPNNFEFWLYFERIVDFAKQIGIPFRRDSFYLMADDIETGEYHSVDELFLQ